MSHSELFRGDPETGGAIRALGIHINVASVLSGDSGRRTGQGDPVLTFNWRVEFDPFPVGGRYGTGL